MKKIVFSFLTIALTTLFAFAGQASATLNYDTAYMVTGDNSHTLSLDASNNYSYNAGSTPWLYVKFDLASLATNSPLYMHWVWSSLTNPNNSQYEDQKITLTGQSSDKEIWTSAPQPWWSTNGGAGQWHVDVNWFNVHGTNGISSADFSVCGSGGIAAASIKCGPVVTPEPLSAALFLLGGAPIIAAIRKKQKMA